MKSLYKILTFVAISISLMQCDLTKEVEIELPDYEEQIAVESYLTPGQPFSLLLTRATNFFDPFDVDNIENFLLDLLVADATVKITFDGGEIELNNTLGFSPTSGNIVNYISSEPVPTSFDIDFNLHITLPDGEILESTTRLLPFVPIDSIIVNYSVDSSAQVLTELTDNSETMNFYRRLIHKSSTNEFADQDFIVADDFTDTEKLVFGTGFDYAVGDTVINTIYHITEDHYTYLESVQNAVSANSNPFGQPGKIVSNITGDKNPIGIFTGIHKDQIITIIGKE